MRSIRFSSLPRMFKKRDYESLNPSDYQILDNYSIVSNARL